MKRLTKFACLVLALCSFALMAMGSLEDIDTGTHETLEVNPSGSKEEKKSDDLNSAVKVIVKDKSFAEGSILNGDIYDYITFKFVVQNKTEKKIRGVQGVLTIKDIFGDRIGKVQCNFTGETISAKGEKTFSQSMEYNQFYDWHVKLRNEKLEDLTFEYKVTDIVFAD